MCKRQLKLSQTRFDKRLLAGHWIRQSFGKLRDDGSTSFTTPPIVLNEYHQVDFFIAYQYKLNVISDVGDTTGSGWYEQGITVPIGIDAAGDGLVLNSII